MGKRGGGGRTLTILFGGRIGRGGGKPALHAKIPGEKKVSAPKGGKKVPSKTTRGPKKKLGFFLCQRDKRQKTKYTK